MFFFDHAGNKIRKIRKKKKIKTSELAQVCGVSESEMRHLENGTRIITDTQIDKIAEKLEVSPASLRSRQITSDLDIIHILYEIEQNGFIIPTAVSIDSDSSLTKYGVCMQTPLLNEAIRQWCQKRELWEKKQISDDEYQEWKDSFPLNSMEELLSQSERSNETVSEKKVDSHLKSRLVKSNSTKKRSYLLFQSLESRFVSLSYITEIPLEKLERICRYVNCTPEYLTDRDCIHFTPKGEYPIDALNDSGILFDILDLMDKHTDTEYSRTVQIQLSRIVLYRLNKKGIRRGDLRHKSLSQEKTDYLYAGVKPRYSMLAYGYYYSDLALIREITGMSYQEMFTGIEDK